MSNPYTTVISLYSAFGLKSVSQEDKNKAKVINTNKLKYLNKIAQKASGKIKYFRADLLNEGSYAEAMAGCKVVFHTASPFKLNVNDPQKELINPAKLGTRNVLEEVNRRIP